MKTKTRFALVVVIETGLLLATHYVLIRWLAEKQLVSTLLAMGGHVPLFSIYLAIFFVLVRLLAIVFLPGWLLIRMVQFIFNAQMEKRGDVTSNTQPTAANAQPPQPEST